MTTPKASPGPWRVGDGEFTDIFDRDGVRIVRGEPRHTSWAAPNAALIADAPRLRDENAALLQLVQRIGWAIEDTDDSSMLGPTLVNDIRAMLNDDIRAIVAAERGQS